MMYTIIGGSGFVGSRLIELLGKENCHNIDIKPSPFYNDITTLFDICNENLSQIIPRNTQVVVLLAAEHRDDVRPIARYYDVNVNGTKNVLIAMRDLGINRLVFTSSVAVYGLNKDYTREDAEVDPFNDYGKSKFEAEKLIEAFFRESPESRDVIVLRPTVIFGERNRGNVFNLLKFITQGTFIMIGAGKNRKSMAYVGNVVAFIKHVTTNSTARFNIFNYVDKPDLTMSDLVGFVRTSIGKNDKVIALPQWMGYAIAFVLDIFARVFKITLPFSRVRLQKFCAKTQYDAEKVEETDFYPPFTLHEGLSRTIKYEFIENRKGEEEVTFLSE